MWRYISVVFITLIPLVGCSQFNRRELPGKVEPSVVLITYGDKSGHGSGFFVEGEKDVCTILTAAHVVKPSKDILIKTDEQDESLPVGIVREFPNNLDLALITFSTSGEKCPYTALPLGNSDKLRELDEVYAVGFPERSGEASLVKQVSTVEISQIIDPFPDGYGISFTGTTAGGMSGGPIVDRWGKVVAIHGKTDFELVQINEQYQSSLSSEQQQELELAEVRYQRNAHFKWAIPIHIYEEKIKENKLLNPTEVWYQKGNELLNRGEYKEALASYDKAIELEPNNSLIWNSRGFTLNELGYSEDALISYDRAIEIEPSNFSAWTNRGILFRKLGEHEKALASLEKAIELNPNFIYAWHNRGDTLRQLKEYDKAIASYDKVLEFQPDNFWAWNARGDVLRQLKKYEEALASYDNALEFNANSSWTWNNRALALRDLGRYQEAFQSVNKALEFDPKNKSAQDNHAQILEKLQQ